jgi:FtsP/CotA-like multicopper oxidase with cupredoxin domain
MGRRLRLKAMAIPTTASILVGELGTIIIQTSSADARCGITIILTADWGTCVEGIGGDVYSQGSFGRGSSQVAEWRARDPADYPGPEFRRPMASSSTRSMQRLWRRVFKATTFWSMASFKPFLEVETALYRFRILNGSNSRIYKLALSNGDPLIQIGTDGGLLQRPKEVASLEIAPFGAD